MNSGASDAARLLERTRNAIYQRCDSSVTLSRNEATEAVFEAWQSTDEAWKLSANEVGVSEEVKDQRSKRLVEKIKTWFEAVRV